MTRRPLRPCVSEGARSEEGATKHGSKERGSGYIYRSGSRAQLRLPSSRSDLLLATDARVRLVTGHCRRDLRRLAWVGLRCGTALAAAGQRGGSSDPVRQLFSTCAPFERVRQGLSARSVPARTISKFTYTPAHMIGSEPYDGDRVF